MCEYVCLCLCIYACVSVCERVSVDICLCVSECGKNMCVCVFKLLSEKEKES